jgi:hypothetical protein
MKNIKIIAFLLFLAISANSQPLEIDTPQLRGYIHSIVNDIPEKKFEFIVDNDLNTSYIYQYLNHRLVETYKFKDEIFHLYVSSEGLMYVTLEKTDRLLIIDYKSRQPVDTIYKKYAVQYVNNLYIIASINYEAVASNEDYYKKSGLVVLDRHTMIQNNFMPATFVVDVDADILLLKEIVNWGKSNESSKFFKYDASTLKKGNFIFQASGIVPQTYCSLSSDQKFISILDGSSLKILSADDGNILKQLNLDEGVRVCNFFNRQEMFIYSSNSAGQNYIQILNLMTLKTSKIKLDGKALRYGRIKFLLDDKSLMVYTNKSNIIQKLNLN